MSEIQRVRATLPNDLEALFGDNRWKCQACDLSQQSYPVHPRGNFSARSAFIAEAAGKCEEAENLVFNGPAADKLEEFTQRVFIDVDRDFLIYNAVFCRPHPPAGSTKENRSPTAAEVKACRANFEKLLKAHNPQLIVACGAIAAAAVMKDFPGSIGKVVGKFYGRASNSFGLDADLYVIWHPAYLLRNAHLEKEWGVQLLRLRDYMLANKLIGKKG